MKLFPIVTLVALAILTNTSDAQTSPPCFPGSDSRIRICSSSCSAAYCGYNLPLAGRRHLGTFITYYKTGDEQALEVPDGASEVQHLMRVFVPQDAVSLHMQIDEQPDGCCTVRVRKEDNSYSKEFDGEPNENFVINDLTQGYYIIHIIHRASAQGGRIARYVPIVFLAPSVRRDTAGATRQTALDLGDLSKSRKFEVEESLQVVRERTDDGFVSSKYLINDADDWFQVRTTSKGRLKISFRPTAILDGSNVSISAGHTTENSQEPIPIPDNGKLIEAGTHYIVVRGRPEPIGSEFGFKYRLEITFTSSE